MTMILFVILDIMTQPFFVGFWAAFVFFAVLGLAGYITTFYKNRGG